MALNLLRNSRVFFTTNVNATTGVVAASSHTTSTTYEIQVLEGFSFSQNTNSEQITVTEAGSTPSRGQRSFNTSLAPVDFSFSTYIRPNLSTNVVSDDAPLWNALCGMDPIGTTLAKTGTFTTAAYDAPTNTLTFSGTTPSLTGVSVGDDILISGITSTVTADQKIVNGPARVTVVTPLTVVMHNPGAATTGTLTITNVAFNKNAYATSPAQAIIGMHNSNKNVLQKFGLYIIADGVTYQVDNAAMTQATIDFGLDGIATIQWTGQATSMTQLASSITTQTPGTFGGGTVTGSYTQKYSGSSNYITNKLSTVTLKTSRANGSIAAGTPYYVAITGGSITINNNINYLTPANLGVVNIPSGYYTGTRSVTGTVNAYLNTGAVSGYTGGGTGNLLKDMLANATTVTEPMYSLEVAIGGSANALRVELQMPSVSLAVPTIDAQAVISTAINFTAAPSALTSATVGDYDLSRTNDLTVRYYSA